MSPHLVVVARLGDVGTSPLERGERRDPMSAFEQIAAWPVERAAAVLLGPAGFFDTYGDQAGQFRIASVSKLLTTYAGLIAVEEGSIELDEPAARPGATVRHLLAHAAGYGFDQPEPIAKVGVSRIYSNTGIELFADHLAARTGIGFADYLREAVLEPLGMASTELRGSPAFGIWSCTADLARFIRELFRPTLIDEATLRMATSSQFPTLAGMLPGIGRQDPCDWGLGFEIRGHKHPHWTALSNSPSTYGHFGGSGTFLWLDPVAELGLVCLTNRDFGPWALDVWPALSEAVLAEHR